MSFTLRLVRVLAIRFVCGLGLIAPHVVHAASGEVEPSRLDEIVVTAQKRDEPLQYVPILTALSAVSLVDNNQHSTPDRSAISCPRVLMRLSRRQSLKRGAPNCC